MVWDVEADVVSVGSGAGGVAAALTTAAHGGEAIVLEKAAGIGGVTGWSLGQLWVGPTSLSEAAGFEDSAQDAAAYLEFIGSGFGDPMLRNAFLAAGHGAIDYFGSLGIEFEVIRGFPDYYYPTLPFARAEGRYVEIKPFCLDALGADAQRLLHSPHGYGIFSNADFIEAGGDVLAIYAKAAAHVERNERCAGAGLMAALIHAALQRGVVFETDHRVIELVIDDGRVAGVVAQTPGGQRRFRARRGVVLATGGYDHNARMVRHFEHLDSLGSMTPHTVEGDHFALAGAVGGFVATVPPALTPRSLGVRIIQPDGSPAFFTHLPGQPHSIVVNSRGERFADEAFYHDHEAALGRYDGRAHTTTNWPAWLIFDQSFANSYQLGPFPPGQPLPDGFAITGTTIEEIARGAGIDSDGLRKAVTRFNDQCSIGVDEDFHRGEFPWSHVFVGDRRVSPNPNLGAIETGPFYAVPLYRVGTGFASAGLATNEFAQVLDARERPIAGLHAVGNAAARLDAGGYNSGIANTRGLAYGWVAAQHLMGVTGAPASASSTSAAAQR